MSAAILWIFLPALTAIGLWFLRRRSGLVILIATGLCLALAGLAWIVPIGKALRLGPLLLELQPALSIAGRRLVLNDADRPLLTFFYAIAAFWFAGTFSAKGHRLLIPYGLGIIVLLVSALSVEPFLFAALLIEMAVLVSIPMLVPPGETRISQGVLRYLIFQTLAMPFILLAGWALDGVEANPADTGLISLAGFFLGLGFVFWLAIFPFYTWVPLLSGQVSPYPVGFLYLILPTAVLLLGLDFLNAYGWLRNSPQIYLILRLAGALMIVTAGIWSAFQTNLGRLFGYAVMVETGFSLLAISLNSHLGGEIFTMLFLPRVVALGLWALCAAIYRDSGRSLDYESLERVAEDLPITSAGLAAAVLTLGGLPLLAIYPIRIVLLQEVAMQSPLTAIWVLGGMVGLLFSAFRLLAVLTGGYFGPRIFGENRLQTALIGSGILVLLLIGFAPRLFLPFLAGLLQSFTRLP
jgi:formate hydrogenlyase subunit 3/multisubunit Na+/H+ antiporter MnhD subunit